MLVSIIIPTFNRAHLISETLESIIQQTFANWECIIVDDGSTDNTPELIANYIKRDNRFQYLLRSKDIVKGANSCRNLGFELSKGEYIKWFDSDDIMYHDLLETQLTSIDNADVSVCKLDFFTLDTNKFIKTNSIFSNKLIEDYLTGKVSFYISGPLWKKSFLINQKELFDENITNLDDWDFNLRMLYQEPTIVLLDKSLIKYRIHKNSLSNEIAKLNINEIQSEFRAIEKHLLFTKNNKKATNKILKIYYKNRCQFILREIMVNNESNKIYFLKKLLVNQYQLSAFSGIFKTILGFVFYSLFKKGYKLL